MFHNTQRTSVNVHNEEALHRSIRNQFWDVLVRSYHEEDLIFTVIAYVSTVCGNHLFFFNLQYSGCTFTV